MSNEKTYVDKVNDWLNADPTTRTIEEGATLMLQGNRNRTLHQNVIHRKNFDKVVYELEKIIDGQRVFPEPVNEAVQQLEVNLPITMAGIESILSGESKGKRADHDTLPTDIQAIYDKNREIYPQLRGIHERLKVLNEVGTAEQRLPFLTELLSLDELLRTNWQAYDTFDANAPVIAKVENVPGNLSGKQVSAARKYLSDNKAKLTTLIADGKAEKAAELLDKMQVRFNELVLNGDTFAPDQLAELKALGIIAATTEETKTEPVTDTPVITEGEEVIPPAGENTEETPEENLISQIKTLLKNNIEEKEIIKTIYSLGNFRGLELTPDVVISLINKAVDQEINSVE